MTDQSLPPLTSEEQELLRHLDGDGMFLTSELIKAYMTFVKNRRAELDELFKDGLPAFAAGLSELGTGVVSFLKQAAQVLEVLIEHDLVRVNAPDMPEYHARSGIVTAVEVDGAGETAVFVDLSNGGVPRWFRPAQLELLSHRLLTDEPPTDEPPEVDDSNPLDYLPPTPTDDPDAY